MARNPENPGSQDLPFDHPEVRGEQECPSCGNPKRNRSCPVCSSEMKSLDGKSQLAARRRHVDPKDQDDTPDNLLADPKIKADWEDLQRRLSEKRSA